LQKDESELRSFLKNLVKALPSLSLEVSMLYHHGVKAFLLDKLRDFLNNNLLNEMASKTGSQNPLLLSFLGHDDKPLDSTLSTAIISRLIRWNIAKVRFHFLLYLESQT
jgi:hypothetical protein